MRNVAYLASLFLLVLIGNAPAIAHENHKPPASQAAANTEPGLKLENLLKARLAGVEGREVIVSRVTMPPHTMLPKHWHPGEEFGYVLEGTVILWQQGKDDIVGKEGDVLTIPLKQVHTAITKEEGATILVFRVHVEGQPERVLVE